MKEVQVSVIVPVYNVEPYLEECLDSIINQTFNEIEIILINDGSTDRSGEIMERYALQDSRITVITQPHEGVSAAKNAGIRKASGKYILFVDSDDSIIPDTMEVLYRKATETGADIVIGNALICHPDGSRSVFLLHDRDLNNGLLWTGESVFVKLVEQNTIPLAILFFMRRDIIIKNKLFFQKNIIHEDEIWNVKALLSAQKVIFIDFNYYFYRRREGSIMNSDNKAFRVKSLLEVSKSLYEYTADLQKRGISKEVITGIYTRIFWICRSIGYLVFQNKNTTFSGFDYFSELLIKVYPDLSYSQQRYCLSTLCISRILCNLSYETSSKLSIYE